MSVRLLAEVFERSPATLGERLVLLVLADSAHDDGVCWPPQLEIAEKARLSERQVRNCLRNLEARGEVETRTMQRGRRRLHVYRISYALRPLDPERLPPDVAEALTRLPAESSGRRDGDDRQSSAATTGTARVRASSPARKGNRKEGELRSPVEESNMPARQRKRDPVFDAIAEECGADPVARGAEIGRARAAIAYLARAAGPPVEVEVLARLVRERADLYRRRMPEGSLLTPSALAKWWNDLPRMPDRTNGRGPQRVSPLDAARAVEDEVGQ